MPNIEETIKDIKTQCRLAMNGMVSTAMRERGMDYRLNFGVEYPRRRLTPRLPIYGSATYTIANWPK